MTELHVFDVSAVVYTGDKGRKEMWYDLPVGGIRYFMRYVSSALVAKESIVLCFDSPSFRNELFSEYKSGRYKDQAVISQIETLYENLQSCGIRCYKVDGYEADDIIDWAVKQNVGNFYQTTIYGNDYDLCHSIQPRVIFKTVRDDMNNIHPGNFETGIYKGKRIKFNTISAYKVFCGCFSDKIPSMNLASGVGGLALYNKFLNFIQLYGCVGKLNLLTNPKLPVIFAEAAGIFTSEELEELKRRVRLVYPANIPDGMTIVPTAAKDVDLERLAHFLSLYNDFDSLRCLQLRKRNLDDEDKKLLLQKAKAFKTGEFAADHSITPEFDKVKTSTLSLDAFTREF